MGPEGLEKGFSAIIFRNMQFKDFFQTKNEDLLNTYKNGPYDFLRKIHIFAENGGTK